MKVKSTLQGLPLLIRKYPRESLLWTAVIVTWVGFSISILIDLRRHPMDWTASLNWGFLRPMAEVLSAVFLAFGATFAAVFMVGFAALILWSLRVICRDLVWPWVRLKATRSGRTTLRLRAEQEHRQAAIAKEKQAMKQKSAADLHRQEVNERFIEAAEQLYQLNGVNMLEAFVEARALRDQVLEETAKRVKA